MSSMRLMHHGSSGLTKSNIRLKRRYRLVTEEKASGATYTPKLLADFVAMEILCTAKLKNENRRIRILDPAVGDGELLVSILNQLKSRGLLDCEVLGFETSDRALAAAAKRLSKLFPEVSIRLSETDFLEHVLDIAGAGGGLFACKSAEQFDLIIANPPYVRTQVMGASQAQLLSKQFGLGGRVDLYHAFVLAMAEVLKPDGTAGVIVSNRFMTTKAGASVRRALRETLSIRHVWDFGDTKLFDAAVLPAVLVLKGKRTAEEGFARFTSIYETTEAAPGRATDPIAAVRCEGRIEVQDGRRFEVRQGELESRGSAEGIWRIATESGDEWLATVGSNTWRRFGEIGKIRVGVKTCADHVFIRNDWDEMPVNARPELLRPLATHHIARRFKASTPPQPRSILYPHEMVNGERAASDLTRYPRANAYLQRHREILEGRRYVIDGGRKWYEIWVPQDPGAWDAPKLVFRDISRKPTFWVDLEGSIVNGDCYWLIADRKQDQRLLWLAAAVGNSSFIEQFYDHRFHNKLYSGRRRFMTQYVEQFPLPSPEDPIGREIIAKAMKIHAEVESASADSIAGELDQLVWRAFGLGVKKTGG